MSLCLSVCVCVCLSQVGVVLKRLDMGSRKQNRTILLVLGYDATALSNGRGSVLSDKLRISGVVDDVIFARDLVGCSTSPRG